MTVADAVALMKTSIVQISVRAVDNTTGTNYTSTGTGFFVNDGGYIATAYHVVKLFHDAVNQGLAPQIFIGIPTPNTETAGGGLVIGNFHLIPADIIEFDERHDVALLQLHTNPFQNPIPVMIQMAGVNIQPEITVAPFSVDRPVDGAQLVISGYPFSSPVLLTSSGWLATSWGMDIRDITPPGAPAGFQIPDIANIYLADANINPGNSGGAVFSIENQGVIGVCVSVKFANVRFSDGEQEAVTINGRLVGYLAGVSHIVPIKYVIHLMQRRGLLHRTTEAIEQDVNSPNTESNTDSSESRDNTFIKDAPIEALSNTGDESEFKDTPQDLKDTTSQE